MVGLSKRAPTTASSLHLQASRSLASKGCYHATINPTATINLSVAENLLSLPLAAVALNRYLPAPTPLPPSPPSLKRFFTTHLCKSEHPLTYAIPTPGATAGLDRLTDALCSAGDTILTLAPCYAGFVRDISRTARLLVAPFSPGSSPALALTTFWDRLSLSDCEHVRAILITSPNNPTGEVLHAEHIHEIVIWARSLSLHLIFDEVYALSVFRGEFYSVARVLHGELQSDVHIMWSMSKDFCMSGLRLGVVYTQNEEVAREIGGNVSEETLWAVENMLSDEAWVTTFVDSNVTALRAAHGRVTEALQRWKVPYFDGGGALFVWADFRKWISEGEGEVELWKRFNNAGVLLTPGMDCFAYQEGFFRICFAAVEDEELQVALRRLGDVLLPLPDV